jgi:hypothetical protein
MVYNGRSLMTKDECMNEKIDDVFLTEIDDFLAVLSLEAETLEIARLALRLQAELKKTYGENFL